LKPLADILRERSPEVLRRWSDRVVRKRDTASATRAQIVDHIPEFLDTLARDLEKAPSADFGAATGATLVARAHGRQRFAIGFDLATVVCEYGDLRDVLLELLREAHGDLVPFSDVWVLCHHINRAIAEAVTEYAAVVAKHGAERHEERLQAATQEFEADSRRKDEFLAILGHELRNPLAPIVTAVELMALRDPDVHVEERTVIDRQARHMVRLVDDLLDVSRIARGSINLQQRVIELSAVVRASVEMVRPLLVERHQRIVMNVPASDLEVYADEIRLSQVVTNLLINAVRYSKPDGEITVTGSRHDETVELEVRDEGAGISAELLPRIFGMFVQGQRAPAELGAGLGLGLTLAKSLTELHGGEISAESEGDGRGSRFVVRLPAASGQGGHAATSAPAVDDTSVEPLMILVVDDNRDAADLLAEALRARGHQILVAYDGPSAMAAAEQARPDVALLDIGMPGMDGYALAGGFRSMPELEAMRLVAVSGFSRAPQVGGSGSLFDQHFAKPVRLATLDAWLSTIKVAPR